MTTRETLHEHHDPHHDAHHDAHEHHGGIGVYMAVFAALVVLTGASIFTYTDFWRERVPVEVGWTFMFAVACVKAFLVASFFMHLKWEANWKYVLTIPATIMSIFLVLMLVPDIGMRTMHYSVYRQAHVASPGPLVDLGVEIDELPEDDGPAGDNDAGEAN